MDIKVRSGTPADAEICGRHRLKQKKALASTAKYPAFAKRGKRVQAFFV
jgi:hypothetical protein